MNLIYMPALQYKRRLDLRDPRLQPIMLIRILALVIEGTTCSDVPGVEKYEYSTILGYGAALNNYG